MFTSFQIVHDPPQNRLREMLCNEYCTGAPPWKKAAAASTAIAGLLLVGVATMPRPLPQYHIAFVGNSMQYYNDFPRFMEALSSNHITQDCCLHGDASLDTILTWGSGMFEIWHTGVARMDTDGNKIDSSSSYNNDDDDNRQILYDMGACTVEQLLLGYDYALDTRMEEVGDDGGNDDDGGANDADKQLNDDFYTYYDGKNPCLNDPGYYSYRQEQYATNGPPQFDFVIINDRTRDPARRETRNTSLSALDDTYIQFFQESGVTPIFLVTYAYDTPYRDMSGLIDVPTFTSLTYEGYKEYAELVAAALPESQQPRLAPVALAFLLVYEENFSLWQKLFHIDQIHASPHGTFLQGCVVHYTIFGRLPSRHVALRNDMSALWDHARRMQPRKHRRLPMPTREEAEYLYHIAERVTVRGQIPKSFIQYSNHEASDYVPNDGAYADNDIY